MTLSVIQAPSFSGKTPRGGGADCNVVGSWFFGAFRSVLGSSGGWNAIPPSMIGVALFFMRFRVTDQLQTLLAMVRRRSGGG